ncbi:MAG: SUMF1/EgtB/PvdO family nonheme iron enzyme [Rhodospirillaceae bacterium]|jgi:formylglycine-generating enzyme required for sulfatase activity|nr:SUMF1/EgtB/PvdO family nonheme iron enzyme [Rhodospirillaceae bacterium]MBT6885975.1 SUMF1/EgtB/PvdO family nonheme iron enzyme [Rhodospirillaceae bacterium]
MRLRFLFGIAVTSAAALALFGWLTTVQPRDAAAILPGLEMTKIVSGEYNLTILVPNSFGRKYHSKLARIEKPFFISKYEITIDQWNACFRDGGCPKKAKQRRYQSGTHPVTLVSWHDAYQFTQWLSTTTGQSYRLPTEEEWAYAAFTGQDVTKAVIDDLIDKRQMIRTATFSNFRPTREIGSFGENAWSLADITGPVWEWTLTCWFSSDEENRRPWTTAQLSDPNLCANRIVQGDERAHVPFFVDKVYTGGCGTGSPVDHIGFRVVRDTGVFDGIL